MLELPFIGGTSTRRGAGVALPTAVLAGTSVRRPCSTPSRFSPGPSGTATTAPGAKVSRRSVNSAGACCGGIGYAL